MDTEEIKQQQKRRKKPVNDTLKETIICNNNSEYKNHIDDLISTISDDKPVNNKPVITDVNPIKKIDINKDDPLIPVELCFEQNKASFCKRIHVRKTVSDFLSDTNALNNLKNEEKISFLAFMENKSLTLILNANSFMYCRILTSIKQAD